MSTALRAGIARRDITPPRGTELFGYPTERFGNEIADGLNATALALQSDGCLACIVSLDLALIDESDLADIRNEVALATNLAPDNLTICATHTHSGPTTIRAWGWGNKNFAYWNIAKPLIVEAVVKAIENLQPVRVGFGKTHTDIGINRREVVEDGSVILGFNEWGPRDRDMTVVRFETFSESTHDTLATLVHCCAHPTSRGGEPSVSRDWPGVLMDRLETISGAPVLFINGAFGDVAPRTNVGGTVGDGEPASREVGLRAATDAVSVWKTIKQWRDVNVETHSVDLQLPLEELPARADAERELAARAGDENERGTMGCEWNYWNAVLEAHEAEPQSTRTWRQTITRLGPLAIVPFAGEIFSEIALRLKHSSPFEYTLCAGTSNGSHGYYVTRDSRPRGGYEVWVAKAYSAYVLAENLDDVLVQQNLKVLRAMNDAE